jgi:anti-anti-sigma regulatory factor
MQTSGERHQPPPVDSHAIRRRVQREYLLLTAPPGLDREGCHRLLDGIVGDEDNVDVVLDLRVVERSGPGVVATLAGFARSFARSGATLTLSHPSPVFEEALAAADEGAPFLVRRPTTPRPLRHSVRGMVDMV